MGHAARTKAISTGKQKSDKTDARTIADLVRCNLLPECLVISPEMGGLRQQMRFQRPWSMFKNKTAGLLMAAGAEYQRQHLHEKRYYAELVRDNEWIGADLRPLLEFASSRKDDRLDAQTLARAEPQWLRPIRHRSAEAHMDLMTIRVRAALVEARTTHQYRAGMAQAVGERMPSCASGQVKPRPKRSFLVLVHAAHPRVAAHAAGA